MNDKLRTHAAEKKARGEMFPRKRLSAAQVAEAIRAASGILAGAARRLKCSRSTVGRYVAQHACCRRARDEAREALVDEAEDKLAKHIRDGDLRAIQFFLRTQGRHRGYVERQEVAGPGGQEMSVRLDFGS